MPQRDSDVKWTEEEMPSPHDLNEGHRTPERKVMMAVEPPQIIKGVYSLFPPCTELKVRAECAIK